MADETTQTATVEGGTTAERLVRARLRSQRLTHPAATPQQAVQQLCALQAQDNAWGLWAVGLRTAPETGAASTQQVVEAALAQAEIVRTWPMRRTLHIVAAADVRWMLELMASKMVVAATRRRHELGVEDAHVEQAGRVWADALQGGRILARSAMLQLLDEAGVPSDGQRGYHLLVHHAQLGLTCLGPMQGKEQTFVLLDDWIPPTPRLTGDEALAQLALRYFTGHGPATVQDLVWWSGLSTKEVRAGLEAAKPALQHAQLDGRDYWMAPGALDLPPFDPDAPQFHLASGFDELLLGYKDRGATITAEDARRIQPGGNLVFRPVVLRDGVVVGGWQRTVRKKGVAVAVEPFGPPAQLFADPAHAALEQAAARYGAFLGLPARVTAVAAATGSDGSDGATA